LQCAFYCEPVGFLFWAHHDVFYYHSPLHEKVLARLSLGWMALDPRWFGSIGWSVGFTFLVCSVGHLSGLRYIHSKDAMVKNGRKSKASIDRWICWRWMSCLLAHLTLSTTVDGASHCIFLSFFFHFVDFHLSRAGWIVGGVDGFDIGLERLNFGWLVWTIGSAKLLLDSGCCCYL